MTHQEPVAQVMDHSMDWADPEPPGTEHAATQWATARQRLAEADTYWLATTHPDGRPHVVPVLAVWVDGALYFCASDASRKARNLAHRPHCVVTAGARAVDLVVQGRAAAVGDPATVERVAEAYGSKYGWRPEVRDGALWADGAPTAGPPPYQVYEVVPTTAFGFPTDEEELLTPTRWRFGRSAGG